MSDFKYLIVGGSMTADAASHGIRALDTTGTIGIIGEEEDPPYNRPPLSKGLWKGDALDTIWRPAAAAPVTMLLGRRVTGLDVAAHRVTDDHGETHGYEKLLLATGMTPRHLPFGGDDVVYYRTVADYRTLRKVAERKGSVVVIGGGFIGSELAAGLTMQGVKVTMLFPEAAIGVRIYPADLAANVVAYYRDKGVDVRAGEQVAGIASREGRMQVTTKSGATFDADAVVAGLGAQPNVALADAAELNVDDGIVVNERLQSSNPDIYAAGDVARFTSPALGRALRVEHEDNALTMGTAAGRAMAGDPAPYHHLPFFYSDLFDLGYEAVGLTDSSLETVADWTTPFREGVVYYLQAGRVRGVLLWGIFGKVDDARALIAEPGPFTAAQLRGRITAS